ncbi:MAG: plastocyanin/azurin family copper-binding protein [Sphingomonas sp.]|jgi:cytochrome c peroxidase
MKRKIVTVATLLTLLGGVAWAAGPVLISQKGLTFSQAAVTVPKGTIVTFQNDDTTSHNILVTGNGVNLNSGLQSPGVAFKAPFLKPGVYQVLCGIHPKMKMSVTVE